MRYLLILTAIFIQINVKSQCIAAFTNNSSIGCSIPHAVFFTDQSAAPDTWQWDFGDGNTSTTQNPVHSYTTSGSFQVRLIISDTLNGCKDTAFSNVAIQLPAANFIADTLMACAPYIADFMDVSAGASSWAWNFGDGNNDTIQNPSHLYDNPGIYTVSLIVTSSLGCTDTITRVNYIQATGPEVNFGADTTRSCDALFVNFTDSSIFGSPITSWNWNFGDGNSSTLQNPTHNYSSSGIFDVSLSVTDLDGCSSNYSIPQYISIFGATTSTDVHTSCDPFLWIDGNTYNFTNNSATFTIPNANGCDSIITLELTISDTTSGVDVQNACDSYLWIDGNTYTSDNNSATFLLQNAAGCDSTVTLNLSISTHTFGTDSIVACDSVIWIDGQTYFGNNNSATHIIQNSAGCDSTVTLNLTILNSTSSIDTLSSCDSLVWIDGITYNSSNNSASHVYLNSVDCDSTVFLDLVIKNSTSAVDSQVACGAYTWIDGNTYTSNNDTATFLLQNQQGCDSLINLDLTIDSVDVTINHNLSYLEVNDTTASYQWLNCDSGFSIIPGDTLSTFYSFTNGNFAVEVTQGNCIDTSICFNLSVGIIENELGDRLEVFPNPTNGKFSIQLRGNDGFNVSLVNMQGRLISSEYQNSNTVQMEITEPAGVYLLTIESKNKKAIIKMIKY
jgi:PKD repeat protein